MSVYNIGAEPIVKTWFVLLDGTIDEIDMRLWKTEEANLLARHLGARYFYRRIAQHLDDLSFNWGCYRTFPGQGVGIKPFKVLRSHNSAPAEMLCRTKAAMA